MGPAHDIDSVLICRMNFPGRPEPREVLAVMVLQQIATIVGLVEPAEGNTVVGRAGIELIVRYTVMTWLV
ncbi:hypothetical protein [Nocardia ignorata]|uniref:hypothetical protein n=1 Tax=Nocardia ignorata TaxID=145285 RepID=UPI00082EA84E|nr:hypothetical protein [Nocardia ignorata]